MNVFDPRARIVLLRRSFDLLLFQVVRAASPVLLRVIVLGAFFIYCTVSNVNVRQFDAATSGHFSSSIIPREKEKNVYHPSARSFQEKWPENSP